MKTKFILSLFENYSFPDDFLKMSLKEIVFIHTSALGFQMSETLYCGLWERADFLLAKCANRGLDGLLKDYGLEVSSRFEYPQLPGRMELACLVFEEKKIFLNLPLLQDLEVSAGKLTRYTEGSHISINDFAIAHESCHYIDFLYNGYRYKKSYHPEIVANIFSYRILGSCVYPWLFELGYIYFKLAAIYLEDK